MQGGVGSVSDWAKSHCNDISHLDACSISRVEVVGPLNNHNCDRKEASSVCIHPVMV